MLAEADVHAPFRREFDESTDLAGKPIPGTKFTQENLPQFSNILGTNKLTHIFDLRPGQDRQGDSSLVIPGNGGDFAVLIYHYIVSEIIKIPSTTY